MVCPVASIALTHVRRWVKLLFLKKIEFPLIKLSHGGGLPGAPDTPPSAHATKVFLSF